MPGQFWALPLSDGSFGCGRVIELEAGSRVSFLAAVLDWHGDVPPTSEAIAGAKCLDQGGAHIKAITQTGGSILGHRPLELDNIEPWLFRGAQFHANSYVHRGLHPLRQQLATDEALPVLSIWGYLVPVVTAERHFSKRQ